MYVCESEVDTHRTFGGAQHLHVNRRQIAHHNRPTSHARLPPHHLSCRCPPILQPVYPAVFEAIWWCVGLSGGVWGYLVVGEAIWQCVGLLHHPHGDRRCFTKYQLYIVQAPLTYRPYTDGVPIKHRYHAIWTHCCTVGTTLPRRPGVVPHTSSDNNCYTVANITVSQSKHQCCTKAVAPGALITQLLHRPHTCCTDHTPATPITHLLN